MESPVDTEALNGIIVENIEEILHYFNVDYTKTGDRITAACPIHGSDNEDSLSIFLNSDGGWPGIWKCWTKGCESEKIQVVDNEGNIKSNYRGKNIFGLIRGLLEANGQKSNYSDALKWCTSFLNIETESIKIDKNDHKKRELIKLANTWDKKTDTKPSLSIDREVFCNALTIPSQYFVGRGFSKEILEKYDVGYCGNNQKLMYDRAVAPIYNIEYTKVVGCAGRSIHNKCPKCNSHHNMLSKCPDKANKWKFNKWMYNKGFKAETTFYNYWFAKPNIEECRAAVLVEGQGDVWRLEEAGINIGLGLLGDSLCDPQRDILISCGVMDIFIATDPDEAGRKAFFDISESCKRMFNCHQILLKDKDVGETPVKQIQEIFKPYLERFYDGTKDFSA